MECISWAFWVVAQLPQRLLMKTEKLPRTQYVEKKILRPCHIVPSDPWNKFHLEKSPMVSMFLVSSSHLDL